MKKDNNENKEPIPMVPVTLESKSNFYKNLNHFRELKENPKDYIGMIKNIVRLVRNSKEYREYTKFLVTELDINNCALLQGISSDNASIEIHHYPFTIFEIVKIVMQHNFVNDIPFSTISLAEKVCELHYLNKVGLVPLSKTVHELYHSGKIFIDLSHVFGNVKAFVEEYNDGLNEEHIQILNGLIYASKSESSEDKNKELLKVKKLIYCIGEGSYSNLLEGKEKDEEIEGNVDQFETADF